MSDLVEICKEFVRRIAGCIIEFRSCKEFLMRIARYLI